MRKIKVESWTAIDEKGKEFTESTLTALDVILRNADPRQLPRGYESFKLFNHIYGVFESARTTGEIKIEETDYKFLKDIISNNIISIWGMSPKITYAIDRFMNAEEEK